MVNTVINDIPVSCEIQTNYPFEDNYKVIINAESPVDFPLFLRIPGSAKGVRINGEKVNGTIYKVEKTWKGRSEMSVDMDFEIKMVSHPGDMFFLRRGILVFSLPIKARWERLEYERNGVVRKFPYCDYELYPESPWNYGFAGKEFILRREAIGERIFDPALAPLRIKAKLAPIDWPLVKGIAAVEPASRVPSGPVTEAELIPYGCTDLRMTVMPLVK
jgi:hypothetical protein